MNRVSMILPREGFRQGNDSAFRYSDEKGAEKVMTRWLNGWRFAPAQRPIYAAAVLHIPSFAFSPLKQRTNCDQFYVAMVCCGIDTIRWTFLASLYVKAFNYFDICEYFKILSWKHPTVYLISFN